MSDDITNVNKAKTEWECQHTPLPAIALQSDMAKYGVMNTSYINLLITLVDPITYQKQIILFGMKNFQTITKIVQEQLARKKSQTQLQSQLQSQSQSQSQSQAQSQLQLQSQLPELFLNDSLPTTDTDIPSSLQDPVEFEAKKKRKRAERQKKKIQQMQQHNNNNNNNNKNNTENDNDENTAKIAKLLPQLTNLTEELDPINEQEQKEISRDTAKWDITEENIKEFQEFKVLDPEKEQEEEEEFPLDYTRIDFVKEGGQIESIYFSKKDTNAVANWVKASFEKLKIINYACSKDSIFRTPGTTDGGMYIINN